MSSRSRTPAVLPARPDSTLIEPGLGLPREARAALRHAQGGESHRTGRGATREHSWQVCDRGATTPRDADRAVRGREWNGHSRVKTTRKWLPVHCDPESFLPKVQETRTLFSRRPYVFHDFVGRAIRFLQGDEAGKIGFAFDPRGTLPCKWKCSDESLFGVDLVLYAFTGHYPFDKGRIGGSFNESSILAAVHHGRSNVDFGGSHVGYLPGAGGGEFGRIWRPLERGYSADCGHLATMLEPFKEVYDDACANILIYRPKGDKVLVSIPNEFLQPSWSSHSIKLVIDTETLTDGEVAYKRERPHTHTPIDRTLFFLSRRFLDLVPRNDAERFLRAVPSPIGGFLTRSYFNIFDTTTQKSADGMPVQKLSLYLKHILAAKNSPYQLKAAIVNTNLEYSRLTDAIRAPQFRSCSFASFAGVFIDLFDDESNSYVNLFQPLGLAIKPAGKTREVELLPEEIHHAFDRLEPAAPVLPLGHVLKTGAGARLFKRFTYRPGHFRPHASAPQEC